MDTEPSCGTIVVRVLLPTPSVFHTQSNENEGGIHAYGQADRLHKTGSKPTNNVTLVNSRLQRDKEGSGNINVLDKLKKGSPAGPSDMEMRE